MSNGNYVNQSSHLSPVVVFSHLDSADQARNMILAFATGNVVMGEASFATDTIVVRDKLLEILCVRMH